MRNMSFSMTSAAILHRTKTVTRRLGWRFLKVGDQIRPVYKAQGLRKGEKIKQVGTAVLEVVSIRREQLAEIDAHEVLCEGLPALPVGEFVRRFCEANRCTADDEVTRIEFRYVEEEGVTGAVTRPALRYHGGKFRLAPWIVSHLPKHVCYVEPFGGAMSVLLRKPPSKIEVYNDLWEDVVSFFRTLREQKAELIEAIRLTPYSRAEFDLAWEPAEDPVEKARRLYVRCWQAYGSSGLRPGATGWRFEKAGQRGRSLTGDWNSIDHLWVIAERLKHVALERQDASAVIQRFDAPDTVFYCDPPYLLSLRCNRWQQGYVHEMTVEQHRDLAQVLHAIDGMALVSGYACDLYEDLYGTWRCVRQHQQQVNGALAKELLWISPNADKRMRQGRLFEGACS